MEAILKEINGVVGVIGSFVCTSDGKLAAHALPEKFSGAPIDMVARVASQTFQALDTSGQPVNDFDLTFDQGRLFFKNVPGGILGIVCTRTVNLPLLTLAANTAIKKITAELEALRAAAQKPAVAPAPKVETTAVSAQILAELEGEIKRIVEEGRRYRLRLRAMNQVAIALACPRYRDMLTPLGNKHLEFGGFANEADSLQILFSQLGYQTDARANVFYANRRLVFADAKRQINADVFLDSYDMYHRLDLIGFITQEEFLLPVTVLTLARLQLVETNDDCLRDLGVLLLEHDLSVGVEKGKIDAGHITRLGADDWGWFKTISRNLDQVMTFVTAKFPPTERSIVVERAQRLKRSMDNAPKSLRWQTRAPLGESVKWYDTPRLYRPPAGKPDLAAG